MTAREHRVLLFLCLFCWTVRAAGAPNLSLVPMGTLQPIGLPAGVNYAPTEDSLAISGRIGVASAGTFYSGADEGRVFVFDLHAAGGPQQILQLRATDHSAGDEFGLSVAATDRYVFVGAPGRNGQRGAVYMYDISNPSDVIERRITAFDEGPDNYFGYDLSVSGNRLIVAAPRFNAAALPAAAYVVDFSNPNSITQFKLLQTPGTNGGNFAEQDVDISGDYAIVSHISESTLFPFSGAAHIYDFSNPSNIRQRVLRATDAPNHSMFGHSVAVDENRALVGVRSDPGPTNPPGASDGTIWSFNLTNWNAPTQVEFGRLPEGQTPPFGTSLELVGSVAAINAFNENAVYLYDVSNPLSPTQIMRYVHPGSAGTVFGRALAFDGKTILVANAFGQVFSYRVVPEPPSLVLVSISLMTASSRPRRRAVGSRTTRESRK